MNIRFRKNNANIMFISVKKIFETYIFISLTKSQSGEEKFLLKSFPLLINYYF